MNPCFLLFRACLADHSCSQLSYAPKCGFTTNRKTYYNTDLEFVKEKFFLSCVFSLSPWFLRFVVMLKG